MCPKCAHMLGQSTLIGYKGQSWAKLLQLTILGPAGHHGVLQGQVATVRHQVAH